VANNSALDTVMNQAADAAASFTPPAVAGNAPAPALNGGAAPTLAKPSMAAFAEQGGIQVDLFLRMDQAGFQLGDEMKKYFEEMTVSLDMRKVVPIYSARGEAGGNTKFLKSYDGVTTPQGQNFQQAVAHLEATTKCTGVYSTAEIPVTLLEDVTSTDKVVIPAGTTVGITPSLTGFGEFQRFFSEMQERGLEQNKLKVKVVHKMRTNKNNNKWGVATFEFLEDLSPSEE